MTAPSEPVALLPCPLCLRQEFVRLADFEGDCSNCGFGKWGRVVICDGSGAHPYNEPNPNGCGCSTGYCETDEEAIAKWNARRSPQQPAPAECVCCLSPSDAGPCPVHDGAQPPAQESDEEVARLTLLGMGYHFDRSLGEWVKSDAEPPVVGQQGARIDTLREAILREFGVVLYTDYAYERILAAVTGERA